MMDYWWLDLGVYDWGCFDCIPEVGYTCSVCAQKATEAYHKRQEASYDKARRLVREKKEEQRNAALWAPLLKSMGY